MKVKSFSFKSISIVPFFILLIGIILSSLGINQVSTVSAQGDGGGNPAETAYSTGSSYTLAANGKRIGIQAGHWQSDSGATCPNGTKEVDITVAVANKVAEILQGRGYLVDVLAGNINAVNNYSANGFISLHVDQCAANYSGYKVSRWRGTKGTGLNGSGDASDKLVEAIWSSYGNATGLPRDIVPGHFAACMVEYYALNPVNNGPICEGRFHQIRGISDSTPGAIIEMGWLSGDYNFITSTDGQQKMATGIANAVDQFLGGGGGTGKGCDQVAHNGVELFEHANCNRDTSGKTKSFSSATEWTDIVSDFNDITSSIYVASGWSIKVSTSPI